MKKSLVLFIFIGLALSIIFIISLRMLTPEDNWICVEGEWIEHGSPDTPKPLTGCDEEKLIGGDKDDHDCLVAAGYSWCPSTEKCQRMWEEYCEDFKDQFKIDSFEDCVAAGNAVMESYPRQCRTEEGKTYTENIGNELEKEDLIRLDKPRPNQGVDSPLSISGEARGTWFFEGSFPVVLTDWDGRIIAESFATTSADWMTEDFIPFTAVLEFEKPDLYDYGSLILQKDNPSGLPENDDALEIPIKFE
ncbi:MAG: hypothetical protein GF349_04765 [Candidatus Magasanikbacteria bacterium]|nr:hypothetical protein [Candidatus Magasanikbacteria bacterium]